MTMEMRYKVIVSDLDGTLLSQNHTISQYSKDVIKRVSQKGVKFILATGRHKMDAAVFARELDLDSWLITSNGARVYAPGGELSFSRNIEEEIAREIITDETIQEEIHVNIFQGDKWLVSRNNASLIQYNKKSGFFYTLTDLKNLTTYACEKIFFACDDHEKLLEIKENLTKRFSSRINVMFSLPICLEVTAKGVTKGDALEEIFRIDKLDLEDALAFGDGFNDYEMLSTVGKGLIMGNAQLKLKYALSGHEIIGTNDEDAVCRYIEKFFL